MLNKKSLLIIVVAAVVVLAFWWWFSRQTKVGEPSGASDIGQDLNELDVNNLDGEFKDIDKDLNSL